MQLRDKALKEFKHYYEKMEEINKQKADGNVHSSSLLKGVKKEKPEEVIARNEAKYGSSLREYEGLNTECHNEMTDLINNKFQQMTPCIMKFFQQTSSFFHQVNSAFS